MSALANAVLKSATAELIAAAAGVPVNPANAVLAVPTASIFALSLAISAAVSVIVLLPVPSIDNLSIFKAVVDESARLILICFVVSALSKV